MSENSAQLRESDFSGFSLYTLPYISGLVKLPINGHVQSVSYNQTINEFKLLLEDSNSVELFKNFLGKEKATHYLDFWFACQGFKTAENEKVYQLIKVIYRAYVRSESQSAVPLKPNTKRNIVDKISSKQGLDKSIFDSAQLEIKDILINDFYQRFIKSDCFKLCRQNTVHSDHSKSSENTESIKEQDLSYVECCNIYSSGTQPIKGRKDKVDFVCKSNRAKPGGCSSNSKDRRSLAEADPILFVQQVSSKLEKLNVLQQRGMSVNADMKRHGDISEVLEDDAESILDNHCSYLMTKDYHRGDSVVASSKNDADIRSVLSHDSGVATTFDQQGNSWLSQIAPFLSPSYIQQGYFQGSQQYKHHHIHDHHHLKPRRRNKSDEQSVCSLGDNGLSQAAPVARKGKSQASDASSIFDSGVSSTYEQISHPWLVPCDRVSNWVNTNPGVVNTPVELSGKTKKSCSGYKDTIMEAAEHAAEVWIDSYCRSPTTDPYLATQEKTKLKNPQKKKMSQETNLVVGYYFCGDPVPYRTQVPCGEAGFTLAQFKQLLPRRGPYRYFFKRPCDEFEGSGAVQEEYVRDDSVLPLWDGKIVAKVEKSDPL